MTCAFTGGRIDPLSAMERMYRSIYKSRAMAALSSIYIKAAL